MFVMMTIVSQRENQRSRGLFLSFTYFSVLTYAYIANFSYISMVSHFPVDFSTYRSVCVSYSRSSSNVCSAYKLRLSVLYMCLDMFHVSSYESAS
jgi:hypothetical protein